MCNVINHNILYFHCRLHLADLVAVCNEIIETRGETPCSEVAAVGGEHNMLVDLDLQHMLKDIWGSDSEDSNDSADSDREKEAEEEEMEVLYEYMSTQRQKLKHGNTSDPSCSTVDGIDDDKKMAECFDINEVVQRSPLSCESCDVNVTLRHSDAQVSPLRGGDHGDIYSPSEGVDTPRSVMTRSVSDRNTTRSKNTPRSDMASPRSHRNTPLILTRSKSTDDEGNCRDVLRLALGDCSSTASYVCKNLFDTAHGTFLNRQGNFQKEMLSRCNGAVDVGGGCGSWESNRSLEQFPVSFQGKLNEACIVGHYKNGEDVFSVKSKDVTPSAHGDMDGVRLHDLLTKTSTLGNSGLDNSGLDNSGLDNSALDLFESFLADNKSVVEASCTTDGSHKDQVDSTLILENYEDQADSIRMLEYHEDQSGSTEVLENFEDQSASTEVLENLDDYSGSIEVLENLDDYSGSKVLENLKEQIDSTEVMENHKERNDSTEMMENHENETDLTQVFDDRKHHTNSTAVLARLSSMLSEGSNDDSPMASPSACRHSDSRWSSLPSDTPAKLSDSEILTCQQTMRKNITTYEALPGKPCPQFDVEDVNKTDTYVSFYGISESVIVTRDPLSVGQSLAGRGNTRDNSWHSPSVAGDDVSMFDTIDLTQDDVPEQMADVATPPGGKNSLHAGKGWRTAFLCMFLCNECMQKNIKQNGQIDPRCDHLFFNLFHLHTFSHGLNLECLAVGYSLKDDPQVSFMLRISNFKSLNYLHSVFSRN